jgi:hypothetical protein
MTIDPYQQTVTRQPTALYPASAPVELYDQAQPAVWVPSATDPNVMVSVPKHYLLPTQPTEPRDLTPQPLFDPRAQIIAASGIFAAGTGWGVAQVVSSLAAAGSGVLMWIAIAVVAAKVTGGGDTTNITKTVHNHNRWFGRSNTSV